MDAEMQFDAAGERQGLRTIRTAESSMYNICK
jgi:hypothetical protein